MMIMGRSSLADCEKDIFPKNISDEHALYAIFKAGPNAQGRIGITFTHFQPGGNMGGFGKKPFNKILQYNTIGMYF